MKTQKERKESKTKKRMIWAFIIAMIAWGIMFFLTAKYDVSPFWYFVAIIVGLALALTRDIIKERRKVKNNN